MFWKLRCRPIRNITIRSIKQSEDSDKSSSKETTIFYQALFIKQKLYLLVKIMFSKKLFSEMFWKKNF